MNSGKTLECYVTVKCAKYKLSFLAHISLIFKFTRETFVRFINCYSEIEPQASKTEFYTISFNRGQKADMIDIYVLSRLAV